MEGNLREELRQGTIQGIILGVFFIIINLFFYADEFTFFGYLGLLISIRIIYLGVRLVKGLNVIGSEPIIEKGEGEPRLVGYKFFSKISFRKAFYTGFLITIIGALIYAVATLFIESMYLRSLIYLAVVGFVASILSAYLLSSDS